MKRVEEALIKTLRVKQRKIIFWKSSSKEEEKKDKKDEKEAKTKKDDKTYVWQVRMKNKMSRRRN